MMYKKTLYMLGVLVIAAAAITALVLQQTDSEPGSMVEPETGVRRPNIILISIDTLRADRLHCYGYARETSPAIDNFAKDSYRFADVLSQYPTTPQSHASLLTSRYYSTLTAEMIRGRPFPVMAELLKQADYFTAGFVDGGYMKRQFGYGFDRGFDFYDDEGPPVRIGVQIEWNGIAHINEKVFPWLEKNREEPFFLFFHCYDVHCPYTPPEPYYSKYSGWYKGNLDVRGKCGGYFNKLPLTDDDYRFLSDLYDGGIRYTDFELGRFFEKLKALDLYESSLIILCSDHGENLGEQGYVGHNRLKPKQLQVPLILKLPGGPGGVIEAPVQLLDILPTVLAYLGLPEPDGLQGTNLLPFLSSENRMALQNRTRISEKDQFRWVGKGGRWVLWCDLNQKDVRLFDIQEDPGMQNNLAPGYLDIVEDLFAAFSGTASFRDGEFVLTAGKTEDTEAVEGDTREQLKRLGYLE